MTKFLFLLENLAHFAKRLYCRLTRLPSLKCGFEAAKKSVLLLLFLICIHGFFSPWTLEIGLPYNASYLRNNRSQRRISVLSMIPQPSWPTAFLVLKT